MPCLLETPVPGDYVRIGASLGRSANTVAVAVKRLRARLRAHIRQQLLHTVTDETSLQHELSTLRDAL